MRTLSLKTLESMLNHVNKPGRYIGNEINMIKKDLSEDDKILFALVYPDLYDLGMANLSLKILYEILNRMRNVAAERAFLPDADMERQILKKGLPLFTLENRIFLNDCDFIGFTIQSELTATNILHFLDLSHLHPLRKKRGQKDPVIIGGGPALINPEPYTDFFDLFLLGDAEEVLLDLLNSYTKEMKKEDYLRKISGIDGVYVPHHWKKSYRITNQIRSMEKTENIIDPQKKSVLPATVKDLNLVPFPEKQIVPLLNIPQNRAILEVARGCLNGCRFCQAGYFYRPLRERSPEKVIDTAVNIIKSTGYQQMSLLSLSISNYDKLFEMLPNLNKALEQEHVNISLPSLRIDAFDTDILSSFSEIKKTGLTFALESMSPAVRAFLNKDLDYPAFLEIIRKVVENKWRSMKIYLMYGFPFEHEMEENIRGMNEFSEFVRKLNPKVNITFHLTPFIPKPGTPLQWLKQLPVEKSKEFLTQVKRSVRYKNVSIKWHSVEMARFEAVMTKADRDFGKVIYEAWLKGARFDSWDDKFKYEIWEPLLDKYENSHSSDQESILPWDHIDFGFKKGFFKREYEKSIQSIPTKSCKDEDCYGCGVCGSRNAKNITYKKTGDSCWGAKPKGEPADHTIPFHVLEIFYTKLGLIRFLSHLDIVHIMEQALNISGLDVRRSFGFNPHKRIAFQSPLSLGFESECEIMTVQVMQVPELESLKEKFNHWLPKGLKVNKILVDPEKKISAEFTDSIFDISLPFPYNLRMMLKKKPEGIKAVKILSPWRFQVTCDINKNPIKAYGIPVNKISRVVKKGYVFVEK